MKSSESKLNGVQQTVARISAEVVQNILALIIEDKQQLFVFKTRENTSLSVSEET